MDIAVGAEGVLAHEREGVQTEAVLARAADVHVGLALRVPQVVLGGLVLRGTVDIGHRHVGSRFHFHLARREGEVAADGHGVAGQVLLALHEHAHRQVAELVVAVVELARYRCAARRRRGVVELVAIAIGIVGNDREPVLVAIARIGGVDVLGVVVPLAQVHGRAHATLFGGFQRQLLVERVGIVVGARGAAVPAVLVGVVLPHVTADGAVGRLDLAHIAAPLAASRARQLVARRLGRIHGVALRHRDRSLGNGRRGIGGNRVRQDDLTVVGARRIGAVAGDDRVAMVERPDVAIGDAQFIGIAGHARSQFISIDGHTRRRARRIGIGVGIEDEACAKVLAREVPGILNVLHVAGLQVVAGRSQLHTVGGEEVLVLTRDAVALHHHRRQIVEEVAASVVGLHGHNGGLVVAIGAVLAAGDDGHAHRGSGGRQGRRKAEAAERRRGRRGYGRGPIAAEAGVLHPGAHGVRGSARARGGNRLGAVGEHPFHHAGLGAGVNLGEGRGGSRHVVPLGGQHRLAGKAGLVGVAHAVGRLVISPSRAIALGVVPHHAVNLGGGRPIKARVHRGTSRRTASHVVGDAAGAAAVLVEAVVVPQGRDDEAGVLGEGVIGLLVCGLKLRVGRHNGLVVAERVGHRAQRIALRVGVDRRAHRYGGIARRCVVHREHLAIGHLGQRDAVARESQHVVGGVAVAGQGRRALARKLHEG